MRQVRAEQLRADISDVSSARVSIPAGRPVRGLARSYGERQPDEGLALGSVAIDDRRAGCLRAQGSDGIVLALFTGEYVIRIVTRIHGVIYILVAAVFLAYLICPAVVRLRRRMP